MKDELLARVMALIPQAADIHKADERYYITVSIGRMDADVHVSYFADGKSDNGSFIHFTTTAGNYDTDIIEDEDLSQAAAFIENIRKKVGV